MISSILFQLAKRSSLNNLALAEQIFDLCHFNLFPRSCKNGSTHLNSFVLSKIEAWCLYHFELSIQKVTLKDVRLLVVCQNLCNGNDRMIRIITCQLTDRRCELTNDFDNLGPVMVVAMLGCE